MGTGAEGWKVASRLALDLSRGYQSTDTWEFNDGRLGVHTLHQMHHLLCREHVILSSSTREVQDAESQT